MDIETIVNFLSETTDKLYPFVRTYKIMNNLGDISEYIKINLKPNINLEELANELKVNIILINEKLEFNCIDFNYNKYLCLIKNENKYEFAYIKSSSSKVIYIFTKKDIENVNLTSINYQNDEDDDEDYKEITETCEKPAITIDEADIQTEEYSSVKEIIKKEFGEVSNELLEDEQNSLEIVSEEENTEPTSNVKNVNGIIIPRELIDMEEKILKKLLKNDIIAYFLKVNKNVSQSQLNKYTKDKLIEMIKK
jgi:hypothetical protein